MPSLAATVAISCAVRHVEGRMLAFGLPRHVAACCVPRGMLRSACHVACCVSGNECKWE